MNKKIVSITHSTGKYTLDIKDGQLKEIQEQLDRCLNNEQAAIVVKGENGEQFIYPSELLKNSFIAILNKAEEQMF
ncbi:glyceraldehyde-3-phosphate dehydrogenase [Chryseobacterium sp. G0240]|uniref:glyceraldehyde-3-phosphate dehydrogenase n=1 Tax=Chryseobacterium sp. G0240 TaxID=2487066 RepID=UPI000F454083|nr:glyceraldehyde-3-phosphate dehydrogenase [Chryseobacterium sp. G0240]ROI05922.1 glyceraldehyde-3-phosphate dehydrogenase [Chryseobacterium sp. G0240]